MLGLNRDSRSEKAHKNNLTVMHAESSVSVDDIPPVVTDVSGLSVRRWWRPAHSKVQWMAGTILGPAFSGLVHATTPKLFRAGVPYDQMSELR